MIEAAVRDTCLLAPGRPVLVMLSGGRDSVCLLDLAVRITGAARALHVNYGLREGAGSDEALCRELCADLGVELTVVAAGERPDGNLQAWARDMRYAAARELAGSDDIAAGHTATDQVETVLYRLASSPGRRALLGMPARDGALVRPLLAASVSREQTAAHCRERGLAWAEDPSNDSGAFARNRIRHGLLAALREIHPAAEANLLATLELLRAEDEVLDELAGRERTDDLQRLRELPAALARRLLGPRAQEILALDGGSIDLGAGERAVVEQGRVRLTSEARPLPPAPARLAVPGEARFGAGRLVAQTEDAGADPADGSLDAGALAGELTVRAWEPGDRMRPLGLGGSKSLQDLFTDRKVPRESRPLLPVVVSGEEIAWVPGVATGEGFRVGERTRERVRLSWHP